MKDFKNKNTWVLCNFSSNGGKAYGVGEEVAGGNLIMFFLRPYFAHNECVLCEGLWSGGNLR